MDPQIQNYINQARASGQTDEQIKQALLQSGWSQAQVNEAFGIPNPQSNATPPPPMSSQSQPFSGADNNKLMAIISYIGILWIIPLLTDAKNDPFVKFHVKQGIVLSIGAVIVWAVVGIIPFLGWMLAPIASIAIFVLFIMGVMNASNGKQEPLPVIGKFADYLKF